MEDGDPMASHALRLVAVSVLLCPLSQSWSSVLCPEFRRSVLSLENQIWLSDFPCSRIFCTVYLGLYHYLRNGGQPRLEIEVGFREGVVLSSTLLALYRYSVAYSLWSVRHLSYILTLILFSANENGVDQSSMSKYTPSIRRFVHLTWDSLTWGVF